MSWLALLFSGASLLVFSPIFQDIGNWGIGDWGQHTFYKAVPRSTILDYGQFPLWNPYHCGGSPLLAHPQSYCLSPTFFLPLIFGVVAGVKLEVIFGAIAGLWGAYLVARFFGAGTIPACLAGFVFIFNSMYSLSVAQSMFNFLPLYLIPWIFLFFLKSLNDYRFCFPAGVVSALLFFAGGDYLLILTLVFVASYFTIGVLLRRIRAPRAGKVVALVLLITLALGAVKFIPALEFTAQFPRLIEDYSGYSLSSFYYSLFNPDQSLFPEATLSGVRGFLRGFSWGLDDNGMYLGLPVAGLFLIGLIFAVKKRLPLALVTLILLWLSFGDRITPSLWGALHRLPFFNLMRVATRFRYPLALCVAVFAGLGLQALKDRLENFPVRRSIVRGILLTALAVVFFEFLTVNRRVLREAFPISPPVLPEKREFYQKELGPGYNRRGEIVSPAVFEGSSYYNFLMNTGTIKAVEPVPIPDRAIPVDSPRYRGEVYFFGSGGEAEMVEWTPNRVEITVAAREEGIVILNQNYFPGWRARGPGGPEIEEIEGLVGVKVPPGRNTFAIYYLPASFLVGLLISLATLALLLLLAGRYYYHYRQRLSRAATPEPSAAGPDSGDL
ncbi:MAG: hypothetical protein P9M08_00610 [Candidatus Erginobacter occultus]|nr:hypothetical protein [Candidatus Erginobacter occultus]